MTSIQYRRPFANSEGYSVRIASGAVATQLLRLPWTTPVQKPGVITKIMVSNPVGTAGSLDIWDSDLSNTTPPTAGSAGAAIYPLEIGASASSGVAYKTTTYIQEQLPKIKFNAGLTCQSTLPGVTVMFEVEYI